MGRGLSQQQQMILNALSPNKILSILEIAARTHGPTITSSEYESLRRAVQALCKRDLVAKMWWYSERVPKKFALYDVELSLFDKFAEVMDRISVARASNPTHSKAVSVGTDSNPTLTTPVDR